MSEGESEKKATSEEDMKPETTSRRPDIERAIQAETGITSLIT